MRLWLQLLKILLFQKFFTWVFPFDLPVLKLPPVSIYILEKDDQNQYKCIVQNVT